MYNFHKDFTHRCHRELYTRGRGRGSSVQRPGNEADRLSPFDSEVKYLWSSISISPYSFMAWCLIKNRQLHRPVMNLQRFSTVSIILSASEHDTRLNYRDKMNK